MRQIIAIQKHVKRVRDRLNREQSGGKSPPLKALNDEIRWRACRLMELSFDARGQKCRACEMVGHYRASHPRNKRFDVLQECLASSVAEHPVGRPEVVGSSPALGSNSLMGVSA